MRFAETLENNLANSILVESELSTAAIDDQPGSSCEIESIRQSLQRLSRSNPSKTCRTLLEFLQTINQRSIDPNLRLQLLEQIRDNLEVVIPVLDNAFVGRKLPLETRVEKLAQLALRCIQEFAEGYLILIGDAAFATLKRDIRLDILYGYLQCQSRNSLRYAQLYREQPAGFWTSVYRVYRIAEQMGLHNDYVTADTKKGYPPTISGLFRQILLFSLSLTNRYSQHCHQKIFDFLVQHADLSALSEVPDSNVGRAVFVMDFDKDLSPRHVRHMQQSECSSPRYLYTRSMVDAMLADLKKKPNRGSTTDSKDKRLVAEIIRTLGAPLRRQSIRVDEYGRRRIFFGVKSIASAITEKQPEKRKSGLNQIAQQANSPQRVAGPYLSNCGKSSRFAARPSYIKVPEYDLIPIETGCDGNVLSRGPIGISGDSNSRIWQGMKPLPKTVSSEIWRDPAVSKPAKPTQPKQDARTDQYGTLVDSSASGYRLRLNRATAGQVSVGELIGLNGDQDNIEVGIVRRICRRDECMDLGVQLLSRTTRVAKIMDFEGRNLAECGLRIHGRPGGNRDVHSILVQSPKLPVAMPVNLIERGASSQAWVSRLVESTASFHQYSVEVGDFECRKTG